MKFVKVFSLVLLLICCSASLLPCFAQATTKYVRVVDDDVPLYTNAEIKKVTCTLTKSYYLTVIDRQDPFYKVEIMGQSDKFPKIVGYVQIDSVDVVDQQPRSPLYPSAEVAVDSSSAKIHFSPLHTSQVLIVATNTQQMSYYGAINDQSTTWYYVYFNGYFGYVDCKDVTDVSIQPHPTPLPQPVHPQPPEQDVTPPVDDTPTAQPASNEVLLIAFAAILATALTCALFLPKNADKPNNYYTQNR